MPRTTAPPPKRAAGIKRENLRNQLWPDSPTLFWDRNKVDGFTTVPRTLGLIITLIEMLAERQKGHDVARVYFELWCRIFDEGTTEIQDEEAVAFASGFVTSRKQRSWKERVKTLVDLGFIRVAPLGVRTSGLILVLDPHQVVKKLRSQNLVPDSWWGAYTKRATEIKYPLP